MSRNKTYTYEYW